MNVAATLICDRKREFMLTALPPLVAAKEVDRIYVNVETAFANPQFVYDDLYNFLRTCGKPWDLDYWTWQSSWRPRPQYDQDQKRLAPIVVGRNMAIDYALYHDASHLLFVDSDVVLNPDQLHFLFEDDLPLVGGLVPGRGPHSRIKYIIPGKVGVRREGNLIYCGCGTCGYMLIRREVFGRLRFRWGDDPEIPGAMLSEDPAYCEDWWRISGQTFVVDNRVTAKHLDSPTQPLTREGVAIDTWEAVRKHGR